MILIFAHKAHKYYSCYFDSSIQACQLILPLTLLHPKKSCNPLSRNSLIPTLLCQSFSKMKDVMRVVGIVAENAEPWSFRDRLSKILSQSKYSFTTGVVIEFACHLFGRTRANCRIHAPKTQSMLCFWNIFWKKRNKQTKWNSRFVSMLLVFFAMKLSISASRRDFRRWHDVFRR